MVEERPAERALEEVVSNRVFRMVLPMEVLIDRKRLRLVVALRKTGRVAAGGVAILLAIVELVLLLIEAVNDVFCTTARQVRRAFHVAMRRERRARLRAGQRGGRDVGVDLER